MYMSKKRKVPAVSAVHTPAAPAVCAEGCFLRKAFAQGLGALCFLVSISFFNGTYDTAQVKMTLLHMGATALCAWWLAQLLLEKRVIFTKKNWLVYLPFLAYYAWNAVTFICAPYHAEASEEFIRYVFYFMLTLAVIAQFRLGAARVLTRWIVGAAWVSFLYGLVQVADRWVPGVDLLPWSGFFGARIFSTHANPNFFADFVVFANFIVLGEFLRTRKKSLLFLFAAGVIDLFFTESKGAWIGFAVSLVFFTGLYANSLAVKLQKHMRKINAAAAVLLLGAGLLVGLYAAKRFQSVSFRLHTWTAAAQMIQDAPVMGTGVGTFKIIYPAYRKPQIFYIENAHNNETQHAENEYLEQWATTGTVGLVLFLWLVVFVLVLGVRNVRRVSVAGPSSRNYWLLAYLTAFFGILVHNFFDISMRFASTGLFFAVFSGVIVALSRSDDDETDLCAAGDGTVRPVAPNPYPALMWSAKLAFCAGAAWLVIRLVPAFAETVGDLFAGKFGSVLLRVFAWGVFLTAVGGALYAYVCAVWQSRTLRVIILLGVSLWPLWYFFGYFRSNHYYGVATEFVRRGSTAGALDYYQKAIQANPLVSDYYQYRGSILRTELDLNKSFQPGKGDTEGPMNDYERILRDYNKTLSMAPNHALIYQEMGAFYYAAAIKYTQMSAAASGPYEYNEYRNRAVENMNRAKASFRRSLLIDPVNEMTYTHLISIALMERNAREAQAWIDAYKRGPDGVHEPEFLERHRQNPRILQLERNLQNMPFAQDLRRGK